MLLQCVGLDSRRDGSIVSVDREQTVGLLPCSGPPLIPKGPAREQEDDPFDHV